MTRDLGCLSLHDALVEVEVLRETLATVRTRCEGALAGNGVRPWSAEYLRVIYGELIATINEQLED